VSQERDKSDEIGQVEPIEFMSSIEFREHVADVLLGTNRWDIPHGWEALARLLAIELDRERTRRLGQPWEDLRDGSRRVAARLPPGVGRLPT
jgi:hypothetical protein